MASDFGLKIGIEGEREFKQAITEINNQFKVLGSEMTLAASQFDANEKSIDSIVAKNEILNKEIETQKQKVETLQAALKNASESFGENDSRTLKWAASLNNAQAELNNMERELQGNNAALAEAEKAMDGAGDEAEDFGAKIENAGEDAEDAGNKFETLGNICKAVGAALGSAFTAVTAATAAAGKALVNMSKEGAAYADTVLTESTVTGIATDKLQEYKYAAELIDVSTETLTKSMAKNIKSMKSAADGSSAMEEAYEALGVTVTNTDGSLRDSEEVYWEIIDALGQMDNETERDALAMQILGKSAQDLNPLITAGAERMNELGKEAHEAGYVIGDEMLSSYGALDDQLQYLDVNAQAAKNALGTVLLPILTELAGEGSKLIGEFTNGILEANGDISKMGDVIGEIIPKILDTVMEFVPEILEIAAQIVLSLVSALTDNLPVIVETASQIIVTLLNGMIEALPQITEGALQLIIALTTGILDNLPAITEAAIQMIAVLVQGIGEALPTLIPAALDAVMVITSGLIDNIPLLIDAAFALIDGLIQYLTDPENFEKLVQSAIELTIKIGEGLIKAIPQLLTSVLHLVAGIKDTILETDWLQIGSDIVNGLLDGLKRMWKNLTGWFTGAWDNLVGGVKDLLGIHSPSTVFAGIGENMGLGLKAGFGDAMSDARRSMLDAIPTDFGIKGDFAMTGSPGGSVFNITIDAANVREFNDIVAIVQNASTGFRRGRAECALSM